MLFRLNGVADFLHHFFGFTLVREVCYVCDAVFPDEFAAESKRGARVQRVLWGSTSTKNPAYSDVIYVEGLIGSDTVNTLPPETIAAFRDHGQARRTLDEGLPEAERILTDLSGLGVDLAAITEQLQVDGVKAFVSSFDQLLGTLEEKRRVLTG